MDHIYTYTWNQKETVEILGKDNEESGLGELDIHGTVQSIENSDLMIFCKWMIEQRVEKIVKI